MKTVKMTIDCTINKSVLLDVEESWDEDRCVQYILDNLKDFIDIKRELKDSIYED